MVSISFYLMYLPVCKVLCEQSVTWSKSHTCSYGLQQHCRHHRRDGWWKMTRSIVVELDTSVWGHYPHGLDGRGPTSPWYRTTATAVRQYGSLSSHHLGPRTADDTKKVGIGKFRWEYWVSLVLPSSVSSKSAMVLIGRLGTVGVLRLAHCDWDVISDGTCSWGNSKEVYWNRWIMNSSMS